MSNKNTIELSTGHIMSFPWGEVQKIHSIGGYDIVEAFVGGVGSPLFFVYVHGECINQHADTLDKALLAAMAYKRIEDKNADIYASVWGASRLLGIK